jgi:hypothetical protein
LLMKLSRAAKVAAAENAMAAASLVMAKAERVDNVTAPECLVRWTTTMVGTSLPMRKEN